ncbi:glycosyltransferase family 8 protein [Rickenella mellea]|uniref:Glycosyltransferase family 8 protein n=1 Tax=Rickenella mellea TaxID=50990 RepID=A0A4Y7Q9S4_9AGAM|nr:glycosyltransferase family 8 protein [Rickenella mellea]
MAQTQSEELPKSSSYVFTQTQDWFSGHIPAWQSYFSRLESSAPRVLEIGCWEGRSATFLLQELIGTRSEGGELVCIDHFDLKATAAGRERYHRVLNNLRITGKPFRVIADFSVPALMKLLAEELERKEGDSGFDWLYIDGSHEADDTFLDGELAWRLARKGAIMIFDDYHWDKEPEDSIHHPKRGIDAFLSLHDGEYRRLSDDGTYQRAIQKTIDMRIGFLVGDRGEHDVKTSLDEKLEYGANIAITVDSAYALPAAVAMRSAAAKTLGRLSFYVVDCGLSQQDRDWMKQSIPDRRNITLNFLPLPPESLTGMEGNDARWAKIDMISVLPVERVLYLDADILVREDLHILWKTDLLGRSIGAAVDVGFPVGYSSSDASPYFNAGVLLVDLARVRQTFQELRDMSIASIHARFKDQDALNAYFRHNWTEISIKWNAQGLGTYASYPSPERSVLKLDHLNDPYIVHFTGPVHPRLADILNPYVQPYTAKPWGYARSPGHPFADEWWSVARETAWSTWLSMGGGMERICVIEKSKVLAEGIEEFEKRVSVAVGVP